MAEIIKKEKIQIENGNLKKLCKRYNKTIIELAKITGYTEDLLYKFDRGEKSLNFEAWKKICNYFDKNK